MREVLELDAVEQARLVRAGEVQAVELTQAAIEAIEAVNPTVNSVVIKDYERALESARSAPTDGAFAGVPTLLKDLRTEAIGMPRTDGSRYLLGHVGTYDTVLVERMRASGMILLGRSAAPELGLGPYTEPELYGPCRNPWNPEHGVGGSSGGAAASVASGMVSIAQAGDGGGSLRQPASTCGLVGLKTTRGRISMGPVGAEAPAGLSAEGFLSRSVIDTAAALDAVAGPSTGDPYFAAAPPTSYMAAIAGAPKRLRIGFSDSTYSGTPLHPEVKAGVEAAAKLCADLGHTVEFAEPQFDSAGMFEALFIVNASNRAYQMAELEVLLGRAPRPGEIAPLVAGMLAKAEAISAAEFLQAVARLRRIGRQYSKFFEDFDVMLTPVMSEPPVRVGEFDMKPGDDSKAMRQRMGEYVPFPKPANVTGQPSISLPLHWSSAGLPIGMQFTGRYGEEHTLLNLAAQLEAAARWSDRRPGIWAPTAGLAA